MTNYEKIKNMSVEEMAIKLAHSSACEQFCKYVNERGECNHVGPISGCFNGVIEWLESEAENDKL